MGTGFQKKRFKLQKIIDKKRNQVSGDIILSLYKGNVSILSRRTRNKAYSLKRFLSKKTKPLIRKRLKIL